MQKKRKIVFSAINRTTGGPLGVINSVYEFSRQYLVSKYEVIFIVKSKMLIKNRSDLIKHIEIRNQPTFFHKLFYEYLYFFFLSKKLKPYLWFSLNDFSPTVSSEVRMVYLHNASPFYKAGLLDLKFPSRILFQSFYYYFVFRINIHKNKFVVVQQNLFKKYVIQRLKVSPEKIIVKRPDFTPFQMEQFKTNQTRQPFTFFYPTKADPYKNLHVIISAVALLKKRNPTLNFRVALTIKGDENKYGRYIKGIAAQLPEIVLTGYLDSDQLLTYYLSSACLLFPSKLESWGLPLSEARALGMPVLAANLEYAHETLSGYYSSRFFEPDSPEDLAKKMEGMITSGVKNRIMPLENEARTEGWVELFQTINILE